MNRGLYISANSLIANQRRIEAISNNIANVNTNGYKKDIVLAESFPEVLLSKINDRPNIMSNRENEITFESKGEVYTAHTDNGYFMVGTPNGISYVKDIRFVVDDDGYLKTFYRNDKNEHKTDVENYILGPGGNPVQGGGDIEGMLQGLVFNPSPRVIGTMSAGVNIKKVVTDFTQGNIVETGGTLDLALNGSGFFKIAGEDGTTYYTRDGSFTMDRDGILSTVDGHIVLGKGGPITVRGEEVSITADGQVIVDGRTVGTLDIVDLDNEEYLRKIGNNLYQMAEGANGEEIPFQGEVLQGFLEESNVDSIREMVELITLMRNFEAGQKVIRVQDEMMEKSSNEIGRV